MIYIHVPFCRSFCTYCAFYSEIPPRESRSAVLRGYVDSICAEVKDRWSELLSATDPRTLYIGGGTPSLLPVEDVGKMVSALPEAEYEEFTVEVNPEDIFEKGEEYVRGLLGLGVNRVSMGVQSFNDDVLHRMGRRHDAGRALGAVEILREAGVENLSIDLIFGMEGIGDETWENSLRQAIALRPEHISAYQLSLDEGSALSGLAARGKYHEMPEEQCARQYETLCRALAEAGYVHYEISNFALPGREAVHNSAYWSRNAYVGLGPGAHSFDGARMRSWNGELQRKTGGSKGRRYENYCSGRLQVVGIDSTPFYYTRESETLSDEDIRVETIMLGLRTAAGLPEEVLRQSVDPTSLDRLLSQGQLARRGDQIHIPENYFFVADEIIRELI